MRGQRKQQGRHGAPISLSVWQANAQRELNHQGLTRLVAKCSGRVQSRAGALERDLEKVIRLIEKKNLNPADPLVDVLADEEIAGCDVHAVNEVLQQCGLTIKHRKGRQSICRYDPAPKSWLPVDLIQRWFEETGVALTESQTLEFSSSLLKQSNEYHVIETRLFEEQHASQLWWGFVRKMRVDYPHVQRKYTLLLDKPEIQIRHPALEKVVRIYHDAGFTFNCCDRESVMNPFGADPRSSAVCIEIFDRTWIKFSYLDGDKKTFRDSMFSRCTFIPATDEPGFLNLIRETELPIEELLNKM